jgi:hypothetical protein
VTSRDRAKALALGLQTRFALEYAVDHNGSAAAARAWYSAKSYRDDPEIRELIDQAAPQGAKLKISREEALRGLLEGVARAKAKGDAAGVIRGWSEVAWLLGFYAPEAPAGEELGGQGAEEPGD